MNILPLLFSLLGIVIGYVLALIAPEELDNGMKYFRFIKQTIYLSIFALISFHFLSVNFLSYFLVFVFITIILFTILMKNHDLRFEFSVYSFFFIPYFLITDTNIQMLLVSLIFLYGFPLGSLIKSER